jgi:pantoate--beta-alanine ligase
LPSSTAISHLKIVRTVDALRAELAPPRLEGASIGLVPTMGALHAGHLSLIRRARDICDVVVVSLFVNPAQFNEASDLADYPRDEARDAELAASAGGDLLFAPGVAEVYPDGFSTRVSVTGLTDALEGAQRGRAHFDGVTTVVTKLLNMVGPDVACFGQKDAQQALVVTQLVHDLDMRTRIEICPTIREPDGLALSSRNVHLSPEDRVRATALNRALGVAAGRLASGEQDASRISAEARSVLDDAGVETEYFALVDPVRLSPVTHVTRPVLALVAARVGSTRLIDNRVLEPVPARV